MRSRPGRSGVVVGPRRRVGPWLYWAAAALILILVAGAYFAYASLPPTVSVSPNPAHPGDHLVVSVQHLPANQNGTIQGLGPDHAITTDIFGNLSLGIDVPDDARPGDYTLSVCLNYSCPTSNVLNVLDFGGFEGTPYMIVEYVEGGTLAARLKQSRLELDTTLHYLRGVGAALDYAHSLGIVHRDVKPANVLIGSADTPILADFGLAKLLQSSSIKSIT